MSVHTLNDVLNVLWWPIAGIYTIVIWKARLTFGRHRGEHILIAWIVGIALFLTILELAMASCYMYEHSYFWAVFEAVAAIIYGSNARFFVSSAVS